MTTADNTLAGVGVYGHGAVSIGLQTIDAFWRQKNTRVEVLSALTLPLALLFCELNTTGLPRGVDKEVRTFRPHVTVSRRATGILVLQSAPDISFSVQRVIFHDSVNTSEGSVYHEVETFTLAGG